jgi:hypothetical protein
VLSAFFMKLKTIYTYLCLLVCLYNKAQINLVPNPSFEDTVGACQSQMLVSNLVTSIKKWFTVSGGSTPDYHNTCANAIIYPNICTVPYCSRTYQNPKSGNGFLGLYNYGTVNPTDSSKYGTEHISVKLITPLVKNNCYYAEFYASLANISQITTNQLSLLLTVNTFTTSAYTFSNSIQPQVQWDTTKLFTDTLNWVKISGTFIAQGGEQYLTIGNFKDGTHLKKQTVGSNFIPAFGGWPQPRYFTYFLKLSSKINSYICI